MIVALAFFPMTTSGGAMMLLAVPAMGAPVATMFSLFGGGA
jgi:hypothetical protein